MGIKGKLCQFIGAVIMSFPKFLLGSGTVWPSYALIILRGPQSPLTAPVSLWEEAIIGSLPYISSIGTSPFGGFLVDKFGRKRSGILTVLTVAISWVLVALAKSVPVLLVGRFVFGISGGLLMQVAWSFTAEISEDSVRGFMSSVPSIMYATGALVSIVLGWVSNYSAINYINLGLALGNAFFMFILPESPVYLNLIGREKEAMKSLAFYRGSTVNDKAVINEMNTIKINQAASQNKVISVPTEDPDNDDDVEQQALKEDGTPRVTGWAYFRASPPARWSFLVVALLLTLSILTGVVAVQVYGGSLFLKATPSLSPDLCAVLLATILLIGSICGASVTDLLGRRVLLTSAALINAICMLCLGILVKWPFGPAWLIPALILIFCFVFNFGGGTIPYLLLAECFVPEVKGFSQSIMMLWLYVVNFILLLVFVPAAELIGLEVVFFVFAVCAVSCAVCTYFLLPETKGLNPYAIEDLFAQRMNKK